MFPLWVLSILHVFEKQQRLDICIASIYVNPTQFDDPQDLNRYPSAIENDKQIMRANGVNGVFFPEYHHLYPYEYRYQIAESVFSKELMEKPDMVISRGFNYTNEIIFDDKTRKSFFRRERLSAT